MEAAVEQTSEGNSESLVPENSNHEKNSTPPPQEASKKSKKDDKNVEQFMKSLNSLPTLEEKLALVCKKYVQSVDENKKLQFNIKQSERRNAIVLKEKEHLQLEFNKTVLVKSKLENLCRELQKQHKAIKEQSLLKIREEEERRKETQAKFQNTLSEITTLLQQNNEKNAKLRDDNISMTEKFKSIVQQYQLREQQIEKLTKQMTLESQLSEAKMQKASLEHQAEKERLTVEMEELKMTLVQYRAKIIELQQTEQALKSQLAVYTEKYDEFQNALVKSNQVFQGFKEQMEMMSKKIKKLEKESLSWKQRWEKSQTALLDVCSERQSFEERFAATGRQLQQMQSLCRTLQAERTLLINTLKENNIERPPLPMIPPPPPNGSDAKVDAMVANCAQLRQSLAHLQSQLNVLTTSKNVKEESPKPEKQKKSKSKKGKGEKHAQKVETEKAETQNEQVNEENISANEDLMDVTQNVETVTQNVGDALENIEQIDDSAIESLIQTINVANINLCSLEMVNDVTNEIENSTQQCNESKSESPTAEESTSKMEAAADTLLSIGEKIGEGTSVTPDECISDSDLIAPSDLATKEESSSPEHSSTISESSVSGAVSISSGAKPDSGESDSLQIQ